MTSYSLYLESGPRMRQTQAHALDLLGCTVNGATTDEAVAAAPDAIRDYLAFLRTRRERGLPPVRERIDVEIAQHVMDGTWLGNGDPDAGFLPDFEPLTAADQATYIKRLEWMQREFLALLGDLPSSDLRTKPKQGRTLLAIAGHVAGAQYGYLQGPLSKPPGMSALVRAVEEGPDSLSAFEQCCALTLERLDAMTDDERTAHVRHGARIWTARRAMRRLLEHQWEHLVELRERVA